MRDRITVFWTMLFPIILAIFFNAAMRNIDKAESFSPVAAAVVDDAAYRSDDAFRAALAGVSPTTVSRVLNNRGYLSIRTSQTNFFGRLTGADPDSGVSLPDFVAVAHAFGIGASRLDTADFAQRLPAIIETSEPHLCQVVLDEKQQFEPRTSSRRLADGQIVSAPLEDMFPFLERDELARNMID